MPRRMRASKRRSLHLEPQERWALVWGTRHAIEFVFDDLEQARAAWDRFGRDLMFRYPGSRPAAFWTFEAPEHLHPLQRHGGTASDSSVVAYRRAESQLASDRFAWLEETDRLAPGERAQWERHHPHLQDRARSADMSNDRRMTDNPKEER